MLLRKLTTLVAILVTAGVFAQSARAGGIVLGGGWRADWDPSLDGNVSLVVDSVDAGAVHIQKFAQFTSPPGPGGIFAPIVITFSQIAAGAVPSIVIEDEAVTNQTGVPWQDFHFDVVDSGDAVFDPIASAGFTVAPFSTKIFSNGNMTLDVFGGVVPDGATWFPGTAPNGDGALVINLNPHAQAPFMVFSFKERPTVPEPASATILVAGAGLLLRRRAR
jgi:hypothetical protein